MANAVAFMRRYSLQLIYAAFGFVTLVLAAILLTWTLLGEIERELTEYDAVTVAEEGVRTEYLVGQQFDPKGISVNIGTEEEPEMVGAEECQIFADFSSAGEKQVEFVYMPDDYTSYVAHFKVNVIFVRNIEITTYPQYISVENGQAKVSRGSLEGKAVLATQPATDAFGSVTRTEKGYEAALLPDMYNISCNAGGGLENYYTASVYCGNVSVSFNIYNAADTSYYVSSENDIVQYANASQSSLNTLSLIITDRSANYSQGLAGSTKGSYVYTRTDGENVTHTVVPFIYELTDTQELFNSSSVTQSITESALEDSYVVSFDGGDAFSVEADVFQSAVVGGMIYEQSGFKIVVDSPARILELTYTPEDASDPADPAYNPEAQAEEGTAQQENLPSLTLFVTDYDMNPLLGTGNGWSRGVYIYTSPDGTSYKLPFYMQAWTWTYVPLSGNMSDVYDDVTLSDFVYNWEAPVENRYNSYYRGTLYVTVSDYIRGTGFETYRFSVPDIADPDNPENILTPSEDRWLGATMGS